MFEISPSGRGLARDLDFALSDAVRTDGRAWCVIHTKPRQEKALASDLSRIGVLSYLPLVRAQRAYRSKKTSVELPLFPGYVFLFGTDIERHETVKTGRVVGTIPVCDQAQFRTDVTQIRRLVSSNEVLSLYPRLRVGSMCRVSCGPLKGIVGVVVGAPKNRKFYVAVKALGQSVSLEIDVAWLEPVDA